MLKTMQAYPGASVWVPTSAGTTGKKARR